MGELLLLIRQLREEINALREQMAELRTENAQLEDQLVAMASRPDQDVPPETEPVQVIEPDDVLPETKPVQPDPKPVQVIEPGDVLPETEPVQPDPKPVQVIESDDALPEIQPVQVIESDDVLPEIQPVQPIPNLTLDEAWDALPATEMMLAFEDDAFIRDGVDAYTHEQLTREQREFVRGTEGDDVFVQDVFEQADFNINLVEVDESIRFPELPSGSRINGLDGYDAVHLNVDADTRGWVQLLDVEYLRVNFEPGTKTAWGDDGATRFVSAQSFSREEIPDAAYVYVDGEFGTATMFDSDFQSIG